MENQKQIMHGEKRDYLRQFNITEHRFRKLKQLGLIKLSGNRLVDRRILVY
jgi:hypothetical protein